VRVLPRNADHLEARPHTQSVAEVRALLVPLADAERATQMAAYMKEIAPYLGITAPLRRAATRDWLRRFDPGPAAEPLLDTARELVEQPEREFAYVAIDLVMRHRRTLPVTCLYELRDLALTRPWWDTIDAWAGVIGQTSLDHARHAGSRDRGWDAAIVTWAHDPRLWARRIALIFQVGRGPDTDLDLLFAACLANAGDRDFFMRKGIGWGLRSAARNHPREISDFVAAHRHELSALSVREATKHLG
jgi:3-methyladenine DNA glycosylase AlkD